MSHTQTLQTIYAAFRRGDIPAILDNLSPDIAWEQPATSIELPWMKPREGRNGAAEFFASLSDMEISRFDVHTILEGPDTAVALFDFEATIKATGGRIVEKDAVHLWRFNPAGQATQFRHRIDTHQYLLASEGR